MNKKNVLIITYDLKVGGSELNALKLAEAINQNFHWLTLVEKNNHALKVNKIINNFSLKFNLLKIPLVLFELRKIILNNKIDVVYAVGHLPGFLSALLKIFIRFKLITTRRGENAISDKIKFYLIDLFTFVFSNLIETNSEFVYRKLKKKFFFIKKKITVVQNIIPEYIINKKKNDIKKKKIIGIVANLRSVKNPNLLFKVMNSLFNSNSDCMVHAIGRDYNNIYKSLSKKYKTNFYWKKEIDNKKISQFYGKISLLLVTSRFESFPNTILESFANGIPVVTVPFPGANLIIKNGYNGYLSKDYSTVEIIKKIFLCLKNNHYLSNRAKKTFLNKYNQNKNIKKITKNLTD